MPRTARRPAPSVPTQGLTLYTTQYQFVADDHQFAAFIAGRGSGKTIAGAAKSLRAASSGADGVVLAPTYPMLRDNVWPVVTEQWQPWITDANLTHMELRLSSGALVRFRSADKPDRVRGLTVSWCWIDEAAMCDRAIWDIVLATLRQGGQFGRCWLTSTPRGFNWVYDTFVTQATEHTMLYQVRTLANPFLAAEFEASLRQQYSSEFARQELGGEFLVLGAGLFPPRWWQRYQSFDRSQARQVIQVWDTAFSERTTADYSVCATWAQTDTAYYVLDVWRGQVTFPELKRVAVDLYEKRSPNAVYVEDRASGQSLVQELRQGTRLPVLPITVDRDKVSRANAVTAHVEAGKVFLPEQAPWVRDFIEEHAAFPLGEHDDQVDTTSMALGQMAGGTGASNVLAYYRMKQAASGAR